MGVYYTFYNVTTDKINSKNVIGNMNFYAKFNSMPRDIQKQTFLDVIRKNKWQNTDTIEAVPDNDTDIVIVFTNGDISFRYIKKFSFEYTRKMNNILNVLNLERLDLNYDNETEQIHVSRMFVFNNNMMKIKLGTDTYISRDDFKKFFIDILAKAEQNKKWIFAYGELNYYMITLNWDIIKGALREQYNFAMDFLESIE